MKEFFHGTRIELMQKVLQLKNMIAGQESDDQGAAAGFWLSIGFAALADISTAFLVKAKGGTDAMGIQWPPLSPTTISRRRVSKADEKADADIKERMKIVRREYKKLLPGYMMALPQDKAEKAAKRAAEIRATQMTGKTKVQVLGHRIVEILRDTGRLLNSLSPGLISMEQAGVSYSPPSGDGGSEQILNPDVGRVVVGTNVEYGVYHDSPLPRKLTAAGEPKLPRRQFLPESEDQVPGDWWENWFDVGGQALEAVAKMHFGTTN